MADLKRYRVISEVTISMSVVVEARDEIHARELASEAPMMSLCHQCAHGEDDCWSTSGEFDGEPIIVEVNAEDDNG